MNAVLKRVAVFAETAAGRFAIDGVELTVSPRPLPAALRPRLHPTPAALSALTRERLLTRRPDRFVAALRRGDLLVLLGLGHHGGGDGSIAALVRANGMRRLRDRLVREGRYPAKPPVTGARNDNFIDPGLLAPGTDLHAESLAELHVLLADARRVYAGAVKDVFGLALDPAKLRVSLARIELTWDAPCAIARVAPTLFWPAWQDALLGAGAGPGLFDADDDPVRVRRAEATERRERQAAAGSGVLRADAARGDGCKLYVKHDRLVRFEAELSGRRARKLPGRALRLDAPPALRADLEALGARAYRLVLAAQANLLCEEFLSLGELFEGLASAGTARKVRPIVEAFAAGSKFHNAGERHSAELGRLKRRGWAVHLSRGHWTAAGALARTLRRIRYVERLGDGSRP